MPCQIGNLYATQRDSNWLVCMGLIMRMSTHLAETASSFKSCHLLVLLAVRKYKEKEAQKNSNWPATTKTLRFENYYILGVTEIRPADGSKATGAHIALSALSKSFGGMLQNVEIKIKSMTEVRNTFLAGRPTLWTSIKNCLKHTQPLKNSSGKCQVLNSILAC